MTPEFKRAVIKTLSYSDIFDYPLTLSQIQKYLIGYAIKHLPGGRMDSWQVEELSKIKSIPVVQENNGYYFFKKRIDIVRLRLKREKISYKKLKFAKKIAGILFLIPSIKVIALTGSLALMASDKNDDIDFLIITSKNRIWLTRFICVIFLKLFGIYRKPKSKKASDKICLNMFLDEDHLALPVKERDLYCAREIVQMKPIFVRPGFENIILNNNLWVKKFLPNQNFALPQITLSKPFIPDFLEIWARNFQLLYMRRRRTNEVISEGYLRFHPHDARKKIISEYNLKIKKYLN